MSSQKAGEDTSITIDELVIADDPERWTALGFNVSNEHCQLGEVRLRLAGRSAGQGIIGWTLRGVSSTDLDGLPTTRSDRRLPGTAPPHANGTRAIDHIVAMSPKLDRTIASLQAAGLDLRRVREQPTPAGAPRQAFFRLGAEILEVVQEPDAIVEQAADPDPPARFWGVALVVSDIELAVKHLGSHAGQIRPALQPDRQIATVGRSAGLAIPIALMSP